MEIRPSTMKWNEKFEKDGRGGLKAHQDKDINNALRGTIGLGENKKKLTHDEISEYMGVPLGHGYSKRFDEMIPYWRIRQIADLFGVPPWLLFSEDGPPCQAYSLVGRARDPYNKEHDPRNFLYKQYVKFLEKYKPKLFVFENVPGILTAGKGKLFEDVKRIMDEAGYNIEARILDASMFGVMQKRRRVILIGWVKGTDLFYPEFENSDHNYLVSEIFDDMPALQPGETKDLMYSSPPSDYLRKHGIRSDDDILVQHISRPHNDHDREIYRLAIEQWNKEKKRLKYTDIPEKDRTHNNITAFLDRFKVVASDLNYSHTMVAHIAKDGHYYIHPDINQLRSLSVREAARIQSFPDNFFFEGPRTAMFTQIGNAVPPVMAESIAKKIKQMLENKIERQLELSF